MSSDNIDRPKTIIPFGKAAEVGEYAPCEVSGKRRMDLILEKDNAGELVKALPAEDLYFLIRDIGIDDASDLVALSSPSQFRNFIDLDCWLPDEGGHELSSRRVLKWFSAARSMEVPDSSTLKRNNIDIEVLEYLLLEGLRIVDKSEVEEYGWAAASPWDHNDDWKESPCGNWLLSFVYDADDNEGIELRRIVSDMYEEDPFIASRFLSIVRHELKSDLNEHALKFRNSRLEDMGFPPPEIAASLFAKVSLDAEAPRRPSPSEEKPGFFLSAFSGKSFLDQCISLITGDAHSAELDRSLMYLANAVMVADRINPEDISETHRSISRMRAYLNLGLSYMAGEDPQKGSELLATASLKHIFRTGFTLTLQRKWQAENTAKKFLSFSEGEVFDPEVLFDPPEKDVFTALGINKKDRPHFPVSLDAALSAGWPDPKSLEAAEYAPRPDFINGIRPFAVLNDLTYVDEALKRAEYLFSLAIKCDLLNLPDPEKTSTIIPSLSVRLLNSALNLIFGKGFSPAALKYEDLLKVLDITADSKGHMKEEAASSILSEITAKTSSEDAEFLLFIIKTRFKDLFINGAPINDVRFIDAVRIAG